MDEAQCLLAGHSVLQATEENDPASAILPELGTLNPESKYVLHEGIYILLDVNGAYFDYFLLIYA